MFVIIPFTGSDSTVVYNFQLPYRTRLQREGKPAGKSARHVVQKGMLKMLLMMKGGRRRGKNVEGIGVQARKVQVHCICTALH